MKIYAARSPHRTGVIIAYEKYNAECHIGSNYNLTLIDKLRKVKDKITIDELTYDELNETFIFMVDEHNQKHYMDIHIVETNSNNVAIVISKVENKCDSEYFGETSWSELAKLTDDTTRFVKHKSWVFNVPVFILNTDNTIVPVADLQFDEYKYTINDIEVTKKEYDEYLKKAKKIKK